MTPLAPHLAGEIVVEQWGYFWIVRAPLVCYGVEQGHITVPEGFLTDFASIPRLLWNLLPPTEPDYSAAALVHDYLYESHEADFRTANTIFYEAMRVQGTGRVKAWCMWAAVSLFGRGAYVSGPVRQIARRREYERYVMEHPGRDSCAG